MSRDNSSRRHSRRNNARNEAMTSNVQDSSEHSSMNESPEQLKSTTSTPTNREREKSSSSVKSSSSSRRQSVKSKNSNESENDEERYSSTCSKYESSTNDKKIEIIDSVRKIENFLKNAKNNVNREIESPNYDVDDACTKREKKRKSRKKRREKNRNLDSNRTENDDDEDNDEVYDDDDRRSSERDLSRSRKKKSRANIPPKMRRKRHRSKQSADSSMKNDSEEKELPITEILRKAQENPKIRHEETPPMIELTTDRIYVQGRNGFSAIKMPNQRSNGFFDRRRVSREKGPKLYPISVAIVAQKIWTSTGFIHQGLLAGMALMHFLLMQTFFRPSLDFLQDYSVISEYYTNIFSYLVTMCVISAFDRFDLAQLDIEHYREIYAEHSSAFFSIPLYIATFCLHQSSLLVDENVSLFAYPTNTTGIETNSTGIVIVEEDFSTWQKVTIAKDSLAVLAWLFVALGPREDMLLTHLKTMEKYVEITENSA